MHQTEFDNVKKQTKQNKIITLFPRVTDTVLLQAISQKIMNYLCQYERAQRNFIKETKQTFQILDKKEIKPRKMSIQSSIDLYIISVQIKVQQFLALSHSLVNFKNSKYNDKI